MPEVRLTSPAAVPTPRAAPAPVHIETQGFVLRTLTAADVTPRFLQWITAPAMRAGLNLPGLEFDEARLRRFITSFDGLHNHLIGIFDAGLLIGFYTIDVNLTHQTGTLTAGIGESGYERRKVYWNTMNALLDHYFTYRGLQKMVARVLASNTAMLFNFANSTRFFFEARLRGECLAPDGRRVDVLLFAVMASGERPPEVALAG